jgi:hypothetical protein
MSSAATFSIHGIGFSFNIIPTLSAQFLPGVPFLCFVFTVLGLSNTTYDSHTMPTTVTEVSIKLSYATAG